MAYKKSSPAMKKKQGYNARLDDSLGSKNGKKKQSMKDRRDESEGMEKSMGKRKFSGNKSSDQKVKEGDRMAAMRAKKAKASKAKQEPKSNTKKSPAKMYGKKKSPAKQNGDPKKKKTMEVKLGSTAKPGKRTGNTEFKPMPYLKNTTKLAKVPKAEFKKYEKLPKSPAKMSGRSYDMKEAYNKDLSASARLHYLENERHDKDSPNKMYGKKHSPAKMNHKSPLEKELVGKQHNLPAELKAKIEASPAKMYGKKSPMEMSRELTYGGPVIDQEPKALSHMGASKVLRHMHGSKHSPLNMNGGPKKPTSNQPKSDTIRGFEKYKVGDYVSEDDFESKFKKKGNNPKNYPQLSVQDYSVVKKDARGKYVNRLKD